MNAAWLRLVYTLEFLVALPAVYTVWSQVGGQGHLDVMPWYLKLLLGAGASCAIVGLTAALVERERLLTIRSALWALCVLLFAAGMGFAVYYYHLMEVPEEGEMEHTTTASFIRRISGPAIKVRCSPSPGSNSVPRR